MKINPNDGILRNVYIEKPNKTEKSQGERFEATLEGLMNPSRKVTVEEKIANIDRLSDVQTNPFVHERKGSIVRQTERLLDTLEQYQQMLENLKFTLKDISHFVDEITAENKALFSVVDSLCDGDELKAILNQALITSVVEVIKFNRGDYVKP